MSVRLNTAQVKRHTPRNLTRQKGVGLIEVLLAVIILSIGFLAAARMQVEGIAANQA